jgi:serine phosphatase RsbU (regulator of sigma subunit)
LWRLRWTSAGHLPPLLVSATGGDCYLAHREEHGTMLGVDPSPRRPDHEYDLTPGSTLLVYTDGLIQRPHRTLDEGMSLLARHAGALAGRPLALMCDELVDPQGRTFHNDVALLGVHVPAPENRVTVSPLNGYR